METERIKVGATVQAVPVGQRRRQTFVVTGVQDDLVTGLLVSRKHPGNFRGGVTAWTADCELVTDGDQS